MTRIRALATLLAAAAVSLPIAAASAGAGTPAAPARAAALGPAPGAAQLDIVLPLAADDAGLQRLADAVSDPRSAQYGQFASLAAIEARYGARPGAAGAVMTYMRARGAYNVSFDEVSQSVGATLSVADAQRIFGQRLARFRDSGGQAYIAPALTGARAASAVPAALHGLITGVIGLDTQSLANPSAQAALTPAEVTAAGSQPTSAYGPRSGTASGCRGGRRTGSFTPNQYLSAYGLRALHRQGLQGQGERAALIEIDGFRPSDIGHFASCFRLPYPRVFVHPVGGLRRPLAPGGEATLDLELLTAAAPRLSAIDVYESAGNASHVLHAFSSALARGRRPRVISVSLGICEPLAYAAMGRPGIAGIERILRTAAALGVSVLASAGDQGSSACVVRGHILDRLAVSYPASSPYVTGVGGTNVLLDRANHIRDEVVWNDTAVIASAGGGGTSILFARPAFQVAVAGPTRDVPDVSMLADLAPGYAIYCTARGGICPRHGGWGGAGGTSAAAPLLAGGILLVDQDLRNHHRHAVGDLNPLLYLIGATAARNAIFRDVTIIGNDLGPFIAGGNGQPLGCCDATAGYDAASGWGSVDVYALAHTVAPPSHHHKKKKKKKHK